MDGAGRSYCGEDKSSVIRKALSEGLREMRVRQAVEQYRTADVSVKRAARIAGVSLGEWLGIARERNLTTRLTPGDPERAAETALDL
ncbi:hypothetical protein BRC93_08785 [Halobacteriales archaeon QS_5_70_15]|nr:MAG: hypothetical protein BRC93_08785 [Halobacteriales archaeon QS_5_70_15]